ncbi:Lysosome membrane protein 2-like protein [Dinothrombium tinctorium]|uniref:Scavenger receptor class B member 1 n=1 Tax=Dinothrombium tinctorium TaxID=1965070 RepID=A0A443RCR8_9ACAR|nr:Lysosome membrane protein 2-like protein [Dinothrombium tinctorium]
MSMVTSIPVDPKKETLYPYWEVIPATISVKFWFFNIENPNEALNGKKIRVSEKGPYAFKLQKRREGIEWSSDKFRIKYFDVETYIIDENATIGSFDDLLTTINPLVAAMNEQLIEPFSKLPSVVSPFIYGTLSGILRIFGQNLFTRQTVRELIFGKRNQLLDTIVTLMKPFDLLGIKIKQFPKEALPPNNTFGLLVGRNNTRTGPLEIYSGIDGKHRPGRIISWKGQKLLKKWKGKSCNMINGSDGTFYDPGLTNGQPLYIFAPDLCRSLRLQFVRATEFEGIAVFDYTFDEKMMRGIDEEPSNDCFCVHSDINKCKVNGFIDLSGCFFGTPLLMSKPHFLNAPHLVNQIEGLNPRIELHESSFLIEPTTGIILGGRGSFMYSVRITENKRFRIIGNLPTSFVPFVWVKQSAYATAEEAKEMRLKFIYPITFAKYVLTSIPIGLAAFLLFIMVKGVNERKNV